MLITAITLDNKEITIESPPERLEEDIRTLFTNNQNIREFYLLKEIQLPRLWLKLWQIFFSFAKSCAATDVSGCFPIRHTLQFYDLIVYLFSDLLTEGLILLRPLLNALDQSFVYQH